MRTVTGLIGRVNRNRYQITTPTATVGIRGTGGVIQVLNDGSTLVIGTSGIWSLTNPVGSIDVPAGVSGLAPADPTNPPQQTSQAPQSGPPPLPEPTLFRQGDERDDAGDPRGLSIPPAPLPVAPPPPSFTPLQSGPGYHATLAYSLYIAPTSGILDGGEGAFPPTGDAVFDSTGQLIELNNFSNTGNVKLEPGGSHAEFGSDGILAWGRWIGPVSGTPFPVVENFGTNEGFHYVIGMPTPVLPTVGSATYSLLGATSPTYVGGLTAPGQVTSGALSVTWGAPSYDVALQNFGVSMPDASYRVDGSQTVFSGGSLFVIFPTVTPTAGNACSSGSCEGLVQGFFAGANAERAGISYKIMDFSKPDIIGAAAFKKN
jgi:hypothetical protein